MVPRDRDFPGRFSRLAKSTYWWMGLAGALGLFSSVVDPELCHYLVANHYKLPME